MKKFATVIVTVITLLAMAAPVSKSPKKAS